jgi:uncharacterized membrane protein YedE/YeeE
MIQNLIVLSLGILFSIGLGVSQMTNPSKVISFLDITGKWDPSLAFVMIGGISVYLIGYKWIFPKFDKPVLSFRFHLPSILKIDSKLIIGSGIFGIGWGLAGFCPGPGITSIASGHLEAVYFFIAMAFGVMIYHWFHEEYTEIDDG